MPCTCYPLDGQKLVIYPEKTFQPPPERKNLKISIRRAEKGLWAKNEEHEKWQNWVEQSLARLPAFPAITKRTAFEDDLRILQELVRISNVCAKLLRQRGLNLDNTWDVDLRLLMTNHFTPPRGTETAATVLKRTFEGAQATMRAVLYDLELVKHRELKCALDELLRLVPTAI